MSTVQERVERGAALLDEKRPDWWREIDLGILAMGDCKVCVLGQVFGDYVFAVDEVFGWTLRGAADHGFTVLRGPRHWEGYDAELLEPWKRLISQRLEEGKDANNAPLA